MFYSIYAQESLVKFVGYVPIHPAYGVRRGNATFNMGDAARGNATYDAGRINATYNMGGAARGNATYDAGRINATYNMGGAARGNATYDAAGAPRRTPGPFNPNVNYSDYVVQEAADLGLVCVPMALFQEQAPMGRTYNRGPGDTYNCDSDYDGSEEPFQYESMCIPSEPSHGTYSVLYPEFPGIGPVVDSFLEETLEDFGAFHEGVPVNPACSTPQPRRSPGLQRTFDIARPHGATFNAGRASDTFNVGRNSNTFNVGRACDTFNVGRASNTFNVGRNDNTFNVGRASNTFDVGRGANTFNVGRASDTFDVGRGANTFNVGRASNTFDVGRGANTFNVGRGASPGLDFDFTPVMNETYEIHEGDDCQEFPSDITHGTYTLAYPDVCFPPTPEPLFNDTLSSGGTGAFFSGAPAWPFQSSPKVRNQRPVSTPRRFIRMDRRYRSNWLPRGTGRKLNFDDLSGSDDGAGSPGSYLATFNRLSREFVDEIQCDPSANLGIVSSSQRRHRTMP